MGLSMLSNSTWRLFMGFAVVLACATPTPVSAEIISRQPFSKNGIVIGCSPSSCIINFVTVPKKQRYEITGVSCHAVLTGATAQLSSWFFDATTSGSVHHGRIYLPPVKVGTDSTPFTSFSSTVQSYVKAPAGAALSVSFQTAVGTASALDCTISGTITKFS